MKLIELGTSGPYRRMVVEGRERLPQFYVGTEDPDQLVNLEDNLFNDPHRIDALPFAATVFDVGGYCGYFSAQYQRLFPTAQIRIFEPGIHKHTQISLNILKAFISPFAIGPEGWFAMELHGPNNGGDRLDVTRPGTIFSISLSTACTIYDPPDLLKIDCEGAENYMLDDLAVLRIPTVVGEFHTDPEFPAKLRAMGYTVQLTSPEDRTSGTFVARL